MDGELNVREWGLALLRVVIGFAFVMHGGQKLFVLGVAGSTAIMVKAGIPLPWLAGPFIMVLEFFGGVSLVLGLLSRWAALLLACEMVVAILKVNIYHGFIGPGGFELPLLLLAGSLAAAAYGPGLLSLEAVIRRRWAAQTNARESRRERLAGRA